MGLSPRFRQIINQWTKIKEPAILEEIINKAKGISSNTDEYSFIFEMEEKLTKIKNVQNAREDKKIRFEIRAVTTSWIFAPIDGPDYPRRKTPNQPDHIAEWPMYLWEIVAFVESFDDLSGDEQNILSRMKNVLNRRNAALEKFEEAKLQQSTHSP